MKQYCATTTSSMLPNDDYDKTQSITHQNEAYRKRDKPQWKRNDLQERYEELIQTDPSFDSEHTALQRFLARV